MVTWVEAASLGVLVISSGATIWIAIVAASTSRAAALTAKLALEKSEWRESRNDRVTVVRVINSWATDIADSVVRGEGQRGITPEFAVDLSAAPGSEPIVDWYLEQVTALINAFPGTQGTQERAQREAELRVHLALRATAWVAGAGFDDSSV